MSAPVLTEGDVHLWHVPAGPLGVPELLAEDERARAAALRVAARRQRYTAVRAALRHVLHGYLRRSPQAIAFAYGPHGKPALDARHAASGIAFSVSHGRDHAVIAVTRAPALGVDFECVVDDGPRMLVVAERIFCEREAAGLRALPREQLGRGFTTVWTRKEAYVKALGRGLTLPLADFEVSTRFGAPALVRSAACDPVGCWAMAESGSVSGHLCTVARAGEAPLRLHEFSVTSLRIW